jgi:hypothetical protein
LKSPAEQTPNYPFFSVSSRSNFGIAVYITLANNFDIENDKRHYAIAYGFFKVNIEIFGGEKAGQKHVGNFQIQNFCKNEPFFYFANKDFRYQFPEKPPINPPNSQIDPLFAILFQNSSFGSISTGA